MSELKKLMERINKLESLVDLVIKEAKKKKRRASEEDAEDSKEKDWKMKKHDNPKAHLGKSKKESRRFGESFGDEDEDYDDAISEFLKRNPKLDKDDSDSHPRIRKFPHKDVPRKPFKPRDRRDDFSSLDEEVDAILREKRKSGSSKVKHYSAPYEGTKGEKHFKAPLKGIKGLKSYKSKG